MQGINPFRATQRGTEEGEPKKETQRRKDARTQREEKRKEKREKIGREMSKVEQGRHPRCRHLATRLKLHPEPTNDSSRTPHPLSHTPFPTPPFPHPLSHTLFPTLPYPTLPYPTPSSLCAFAFNSSLCVLAPLRLCVQFFPLRPCVFASLRSILPFASLRLCVFAFNSSLCVFAFNSFRLHAWPRRMNFANGSHSGKGSSPRPRSVSGARPRAIDRPALGSDRLGLPFAGSG